MKKLTPPNLGIETIRLEMERTVGKLLRGLDSYNQSDYQKILEICQLGKLLVTYFPKYSIEEVRERPDFIISNGKKRIAIEHQTVLNVKTKMEQGFYENIFHIVERDLQNEKSLPGFLANCYLNENLSYKNSDKNTLIGIAKEVISEFVLNDNFIENPLIRKIRKMPHSKMSINVNFGAFWVQNIDSETLIDFIAKKEDKVESYRKSTGLEQWLVLVTGGATEYSFEVDEPIETLSFKTSFDKIFLLADFKNELYELK